MLRLDLTREARWVDLLPGVRIRIEPVTSAIMMAVRMDPAVRGLPAEAGPAAAATAATKAAARRVIVAWEGVGDEAGEPVEVTAEGIDALLDIWPAFEAFQLKVMAPVMAVEQEKNV